VDKQKSVIGKLASSLNRRDEVPNQELAAQIAKNKDADAVKILIENLQHKSKDIQNDCIKVLYETGEKSPGLIAEFARDFIVLLGHKNNRLQWGAMTALSTIVNENPKIIYDHLPQLIGASDSGSVITKDNLVKILVSLCGQKKYAEKVFPLLNEELLKSAANQLPMYAENAVPVINETNRKLFIKTLQSRLDSVEKDSKKKRIEKVIRKFSQEKSSRPSAKK